MIWKLFYMKINNILTRCFTRIDLRFLEIISWSCTIVIVRYFYWILIIIILRNRTKFLLFLIIKRLRINQFCMSTFFIWHRIIKWFQLKCRCLLNFQLLRFWFCLLKTIITIVVSLFNRHLRPWFWSWTCRIEIFSLGLIGYSLIKLWFIICAFLFYF